MPRRIRVVQVGAWGLVLAGIAGFGMAGLGLLREIKGAEERHAALSAGPPEVVAIEDFDAKAPRNPAGEVKLAGQLDVAMQYDLRAAAWPGADRRGVMIPLYPLGAVSPATPARGVLIYDQGPDGTTFGEAEINALLAQIEGEGGVGPIVRLGGRLRHSTPFDALIAERFARDGRSLDADFLRIAPFRGDRTQALSRGPRLDEPVKRGFLAAILMLLGMILLARTGNRRRGLRASAERTDRTAPTGREGDSAAEGAAGLSGGAHVAIAPYSPEMADGASGAAVMREVLTLGPMPGERTCYSPRRADVEDFAALDSGGLKRPLAGRGVPERLAGPKPVKKASPLAGTQDATAAADILAAVQARVGPAATGSRADDPAGHGATRGKAGEPVP